jgi:hypothetical protein
MLCYIGIDSPNQTEFIYAQIVRDELGYGGSVKKFIPSPTNRLMDFMRGEPEAIFIIIGSAELSMGKFLVFYKFMEAFHVVSKEGVRLLLDFEVCEKEKKEKTPTPMTKATILSIANSARELRPDTPELSR